MSFDPLDELRRDFRPWAVWLIGHAAPGWLQVTSVYRSTAEQRRLYVLRQAGRWPFPVAPPGCSMHNHRLAWDMVESPNWERTYGRNYRGWLLKELGRIWTEAGGQWGGSRDPIHFGVRGRVC